MLYTDLILAPGNASALPPPGKKGRLYGAQDVGAIYYDDGTSWVVYMRDAATSGGLPPGGTQGQVLTLDGNPLSPTWETPAAASSGTGGGFASTMFSAHLVNPYQPSPGWNLAMWDAIDIGPANGSVSSHLYTARSAGIYLLNGMVRQADSSNYAESAGMILGANTSDNMGNSVFTQYSGGSGRIAFSHSSLLQLNAGGTCAMSLFFDTLSPLITSISFTVIRIA